MHRSRPLAACLTALLALPFLALAAHHEKDETYAETKEAKEKKGPSAYIAAPQHGETVPTTFTVKFGLEGFGVAPAGVDFEKTGHHHLLVDLKELPALDKPLPTTDHILHFGGGQTQTTLTLPPGKRTLQLLLGDYLHIPHDPPIKSKKIVVYVVEDAK